jgi:hypothetical protein
MSDFDITLDASDKNVVTPTGVAADGSPSSAPLEIGINGPGDANRLLIFTGIALPKADFAEDDEILRRGSVRVRLNYPLAASVKFISSSTTACLANIFNLDDEDTTFAVESSSTEPQAIDAGNPQSGTELVLTANLAVQGGDTGISGMAYQANVLVQDLTPEFESILVRSQGVTTAFSDSIQVQPSEAWDYQISFTGPVFTVAFVELSSSDPFSIPIATSPNPIGFGVRIQPGQKSAVFTAPPTRDSPLLEGRATITARFTHPDQSVVIEKTATVQTKLVS